MFFVVRSNDSFNFPLGLIKYIVISAHGEVAQMQKITSPPLGTICPDIRRHQASCVSLRTICPWYISHIFEYIKPHSHHWRPRATYVFTFMSGMCHKTALPASPAAWNFAFLMSASPVHSTSFPQSSREIKCRILRTLNETCIFH